MPCSPLPGTYGRVVYDHRVVVRKGSIEILDHPRVLLRVDPDGVEVQDVFPPPRDIAELAVARLAGEEVPPCWRLRCHVADKKPYDPAEDLQHVVNVLAGKRDIHLKEAVEIGVAVYTGELLTLCPKKP